MLATHSHSDSSPTKHRGRPSISSPISWLSSRASLPSNPSSPSRHPTPSPLKISDPKLVHDMDGFTAPTSRMAPLGEGAVLVNSIQEALGRSNTVHPVVEEDEQEVSADVEMHNTATHTLPSDSAPSVSPDKIVFSPLLTRSIHLRSSNSSGGALTNKSVYSLPPSPVSHKEFLHAPPVVDEVLPPTPPFNPVLLAPFPEHKIEMTQTVITIETATESYRTTLATLMSRPSHLSRYLQSLLPSAPSDIPETLPESPLSPHFSVLFHDHTSSTPLQSVPHVFLDRPSAPYAHILAYLRTPTTTPASLPRSARLQPPSLPRVEALLELRDEAHYLDLNELYLLCCDELGQRPMRSRCDSGVSFGNIVTSSADTTIRRGSAESLSSTAVESPRAATKPLPENYIPPAATLKARSRSDSRGDGPRPRPPTGWL